MAIEFRCSQCNQLLRVSDASAGKNARCPKCQALMTVPATSSEPSAAAPPSLGPALPSAAPAPSYPPPVPAQPENPFGFMASGGGANKPPSPPAPPPPKPPGNPFGDNPEGSPFAISPTAAINPYIAPVSGREPFTTSFAASAAAGNVPVTLDPILSHAWRVWQANLGLLLGVTLTTFGIVFALYVGMILLVGVIQQMRAPELILVVLPLAYVVLIATMTFVGVGQAQISLKLARGQGAAFGDLFAGGQQFLPVLGALLLAGIAVNIGFALCIVPGILLILWFWPFYYLVVDNKASVMDSFSLAAKITEGNRGTTFLVWLVSFGIILCGELALCIGVLFAMPFVSVLWATAYLMMSGQLASHPQYAKY